MRESCRECILKHLAQAEVLMEEAKLGYEWHKWYAVGHLAEAEAESLKAYPKLAEKIRELRKAYIEGKDVDMDIFIIQILDVYFKEV